MLQKKAFYTTIRKNSYFWRHQLRSLSSTVDLDNAKPYEAIPGPKNSFELLRLMGPGGRYKNLPLDQLVVNFRKDYGTIAKFPGFMGQRPMVMTFLPEDIEKVLRTEGKNPFRRPLDSMIYFRKQHRPDLYPAGAGLIVT